MAYKALYRTYRPQRFADVIGQDVIVKTLQNVIKNNRISHAYLFCGPRGTGKTTIARVFAKALNCHNLNNLEPCNNCSSCEEVTEGISPDVIEIDAASNNGVDEIRELKEKVKFLPAGAKYKIYIIDEVHMLSTSAFNALLKTLEEPPRHVIFILATTEPHKVLSTIVSRCQRYDFKSLTIEDLVNSLKNVCVNEDVLFDDEALKTIAIASDGGFRDALSFLDQAISLSDDKVSEEVAANVTGLVGKDKLIELAKDLEDKKISESLQLVQDLQNSGREIGKIISSLLSFYRDILLCKNISNNYDERYIQFANIIDIRKIYFNIDVLSDVQTKIRYGSTPDIYFEVAIIKMINASSEDLDFGKRISLIENQLMNNDFESNKTTGSVEDIKRLRLLEEKFNNLLSELSKLEIPKLIERVKNLENIPHAGIVNSDTNLKEVTNRVDKIIEDLELLKVVQNTLRSELDNSKTGEIDEVLLTEKIEESVKKVKPNINYTDIETFIKRQLEYFEEKLNKKIDDFEPIAISSVVSTDEKVINEIDNLKIIIKKLENKIKDFEALELKEDFGENKEKDIINKQYDYSDDIKDIKIKIEELENSLLLITDKNDDNSSIENTLEIRINKLEKEINNLNSFSTIDSNTSNIDSSEINKILERITKAESNIYKIMAGMLSLQPQPKKNKQKVDDKQISLFKDEIVEVEKINNTLVTPKTDFLDFAKIDEKGPEKNINSFELTTEDDLNINDSIVDEKVINSEDNLFGETEFDSPDDNNSLNTDDNDISDNNQETKGFDLFDDVPEVDSEKENSNQSIEIEENIFEEEVIDEEELIRQQQEEQKRIDEIKQIRIQEEKARQEEIKRQEEERLRQELEFKRKQDAKEALRLEEEERERVIAEQKRKQLELDVKKELENQTIDTTSDLDEYERYDVKVLERIINDSFSPEYGSEVARLTNLWKHIVSLAPVEKRGVAEILSEGEIKAVGNHEFVLIYNNAIICNQVMSRRFKRSSLKLLFDLLDSDYNYFAITREVWIIKKREYSDQYSLGIKHPTLKPILDQDLHVSNDEEDEDEKMIKNVINVFGDNVTIKKRSD